MSSTSLLGNLCLLVAGGIGWSSVVSFDFLLYLLHQFQQRLFGAGLDHLDYPSASALNFLFDLLTFSRGSLTAI